MVNVADLIVYSYSMIIVIIISPDTLKPAHKGPNHTISVCICCYAVPTHIHLRRFDSVVCWLMCFVLPHNRIISKTMCRTMRIGFIITSSCIGTVARRFHPLWLLLSLPLCVCVFFFILRALFLNDNVWCIYEWVSDGTRMSMPCFEKLLSFFMDVTFHFIVSCHFVQSFQLCARRCLLFISLLLSQLFVIQASKQ